MSESTLPLASQSEDRQVKRPPMDPVPEKESGPESTLDISTNYEPHSSKPTTYTVRITEKDGTCSTIECKNVQELTSFLESRVEKRQEN